MHGALLALALVAGPAPTPTASPTPPPRQDEPPEEQETDFVPPEPHRRNMPDMAIVPSLGLGGFVGEDGHERSIGGLHLWAGVLIHPAPSALGPFMGVGGSFDEVYAREGDSLDGDTWYGTAEVRYGVAWLIEPRRYEGALFPGLAVYAIGGWRPERGSSGLYRAGGGVSSPVLLALGASEACVPVPSMVEVVVDAPEGRFSGDDSRLSVRAGWQF